MAPHLQRTTRHIVGCEGVALHSGKMTRLSIKPAPENTGIIFKRVDLGIQVPALWNHVVSTRFCTVLGDGNGVDIATVEHLMAALYGMNIDNVIVEVDGPELPIMDGSAAPFVFLLECAGHVEQSAPRRALQVLKKVEVSKGRCVASLAPADTFMVTFESPFERLPSLQVHQFHYTHGPELFKMRLARARTFGFLEDVDVMRAAGLARGGSLDNAIVFSEDGKTLNPEGLRYADEVVRHKVLDACGDLYLAGGLILGKFHGFATGHEMHALLLQKLFTTPGATRWVTLDSTSATAQKYA